MQTRFLLGPAGSGKTFRCLEEIRHALKSSPDGPPLLLLAPKQSTYQLERQLLEDATIGGFTRLHILSFERLAKHIFENLKLPEPRMLDEEGRLMVLRAILTRKRDSLRLFRASARLNGFARHLSEALRELQRENLNPEAILHLADSLQDVPGLNHKLEDLATLLGEYLGWLEANGLQDSDRMLGAATLALAENSMPFKFGAVWVDGFAEFSGAELELLSGILPHSEQATIALCLNQEPRGNYQRSTQWMMPERTLLQCRKRFGEIAGCELMTERLMNTEASSRYGSNPVFHHLESAWETPTGYNSDKKDTLGESLRLVRCANPEAETVLAAQEILRFVRKGGRYSDAAVLVRQLDAYHETLVNVFTRYEIPFFLDRREIVAHHPLAELSRGALRTLGKGWEHGDWFGVMKTGLTGIPDLLVDKLENEALSHGWKGEAWQKELVVPDNAELSRELNAVRKPLVELINALGSNLGLAPDGLTLATELRKFWAALDVFKTLEDWSRLEKAAPNPLHLTVWEQMEAWLKNIELAFANHPISLHEWLPIVDAGLGGLSVGVVPPMMDQVLVGAIDRSRNPELKLAILLGMNEGLFPAPPRASVLLTDTDRTELEAQGIPLPTAKRQLFRERFFAYIMFTRARERLVISRSAADSEGNSLNESPFIAHFKRIFPSVEQEDFHRTTDWRESEHTVEVAAPMLKNLSLPEELRDGELISMGDTPALRMLSEKLRHVETAQGGDSLTPTLAELLYGMDIRTSVSRMEQFAACPFKFFVNSGLRAEERVKFEMDVRDRGNFQHDILEEFHNTLKDAGKKWRDITPAEARERVAAIAAGRVVSFRNGLLIGTEEGKFAARMMTESLQDFVATLVGWMRSQYGFDPVVAEFPFGDKEGVLPPWMLDLGAGHRLILNGRIDRIDLCRETPESSEALCVVIDYKSSDKKLDPVLMANGLQLQLPAYLNVLRNWAKPSADFGVAKLIPAGVFYVNLRGEYERSSNRDDALADLDGDRRNAYRHKGRFNQETLPKLDQRTGQSEGDQFNYSITKKGVVGTRQKDPMKPEAFNAMLDMVESSLAEMGRLIYAGTAKVDPYRKGTKTPCEYCDYSTICRIDPWTHQYRQLKKPEEAE